MTTVIIPAVGALLGTVVGALGTFLVTWLNVRAQREQLERTRAQQVLDVRREAYVTYMSQANYYYECTREIADALGKGLSDEQVQEIDGRWREAWRQLETSIAAVRILGPQNMAEAARALQRAAGDAGESADGWVQSRNRRPAKLNPAMETLSARIKEFAAAAQAQFE